MPANPTQFLKSGDGVLIVDVQRDFCPGGLLALKGGDDVIPVLNQWIAAAVEKQVPVYVSRDWHPREHPSFQEQDGVWPVHCVQDTEGAQFHPDLKLPKETIVISKGTRFDHDQYSAFSETGFAEKLKQDRVRRLWVGGLALDVCVKATSLEARKAGFEVHLLLDATRPVDASAKDKVLSELKDAGVHLEA